MEGLLGTRSHYKHNNNLCGILVKLFLSSSFISVTTPNFVRSFAPEARNENTGESKRLERDDMDEWDRLTRNLVYTVYLNHIETSDNARTGSGNSSLNRFGIISRSNHSSGTSAEHPVGMLSDQHSTIGDSKIGRPEAFQSIEPELVTGSSTNSNGGGSIDHGSLYDLFFRRSDANESEWLNGAIQDSRTVHEASSPRLFLLDFILAILLALITLSTVIGNALVIAAILRERHLRSVGNYLVFSLALADLLVAILVMPLSAVYIVTGEWTMGAAFCDLWTVADVLCCTSSILHLLAIAVVSAMFESSYLVLIRLCVSSISTLEHILTCSLIDVL